MGSGSRTLAECGRSRGKAAAAGRRPALRAALPGLIILVEGVIEGPAMQPELRHVIDRSKFHKSAVEAVAALLPAGDAELDALIGEAVKEKDQSGFVYVMVAALARGRPVDARHLAGGAMMIKDEHLLGALAWQASGEVPEALLHAMQHTILAISAETALLFLIAVWCREHGGRALPNGLIAHARTLARSLRMKREALPYLMALALLVDDAGLRAVVAERLSKSELEKVKKFGEISRDLGELYLGICRTPMKDLIPAAAPRELAQGFTMRRSVAKLGRNDPCPCGSGKKHKQCCIAKTEERLHFSTDVAGKTVEEVLVEPEPHLTQAKLMKAPPHEAARWDPRKLKPELRKLYFEKLVAFHLVDRAVEALELLGWAGELEKQWDHVLFWSSVGQRKDLVQRVLKVRPESAPIDGDLPTLTALVLADDDPAQMIQILERGALKALQGEESDQLAGFAYAVMASKFRSIGIFVVRSMIALLPQDKASRLFELLLEARDQLNLPPDDPFGEILDERFRTHDPGEGEEAEALREAQHRLDEKAGEVRVLKEGLARLHAEMQAREQAPAAGIAPSAPAPPVVVDEHALLELRRKVEGLKGALKERHLERNELRRELQKAHANLETLRAPAAAPGGGPAEDAQGADAEAELLLPPEPPLPQPVRVIEFPKDFHARLGSLPRAVARGTLTLLGRLAAGETAAFVGMVRLKACHHIFRQRIGSDFRLLFRLLPDRVQVVDLIPRQDLLRRIKTLV